MVKDNDFKIAFGSILCLRGLRFLAMKFQRMVRLICLSVSLSGAKGRRGKKGQQGYFVPQAPIIVNANMGHTCKCQGRGIRRGISLNAKEGRGGDNC